MYLRILFAIMMAVPLFGDDLSAVNIRLHEHEDGLPVPSGQAFRASETVYLSFQISGFQATEDDHIQLGYEISTMDPSGKHVGPVKSGKIEAELAPEDKKKGKEWKPKVRYQIQLPATPAPGSYKIQIHLDDKINGGKAEQDVPFTVASSAPGATESLTIHNFRFLRSESDKDRLPEGGSFRRGDAVWARFDITGYKFGPGNRYSVKYGLALKDPSGKTLFANPNAAEDTSESFYPRTFVPGEFSLHLDKNGKPGDYMLVISLSDPVGNQSIESNHVFRVE
jgi:hypothetical protein